MKKTLFTVAAVAAAAAAGLALAQYPILDLAAGKVTQKYQNTTCEQLWQNRGKPPSAEEQRVLEFLRNDPQARQYFFNQIAGPVMNKMFECGMIP